MTRPLPQGAASMGFDLSSLSDLATDLCAALALIWLSGIVVITGADYIRDLVRRHRLVANRRGARLMR
jgi:hypothetical protein